MNGAVRTDPGEKAPEAADQKGVGTTKASGTVRGSNGDINPVQQNGATLQQSGATVQQNGAAVACACPCEDEISVEDSPYSWIVALGSVISMILLGGILKSMGLLLATLAQDGNYTAAQVSSIPAVYFAFNTLLAPVGGALCRRFSERIVAIAGAVLSSVGLFLSGFTIEIWILCITMGLVFGSGQTCANIPCSLMVTKYFVKRRGFANAIGAAAIALGGVVFPVMTEAMLEEFGLSGTAMLYAGLFLHGMISGMLFRPLEKQRHIVRLEKIRKHKKRHRTGGCGPDCEFSGACAHGPKPGQLLQCPKVVVTRCSSEASMTEVALSSRIPDRASDLEGNTSDDEEDGDGKRSRRLLGGEREQRPSLIGSTLMLSQPSLVVEAPPLERGGKQSCWSSLLQYMDLTVLKQPLFLITMASVFLFCTGLPHVCIILPQYALDLDITRAQTANMISLLAPVDIVGSLALGALLDRNLFPKRFGLMIACMVGAGGILGLALATSYTGVFISSALAYAAVGGYFVVMPVICADYYGVDLLSTTLTLTTMFFGVANLVAQPLCGMFRDAVGSFRPVLFLLFALVLTAGGLVLFHPCVLKRYGDPRSTHVKQNGSAPVVV